MDFRFVELARDGEPTRPLTPTASSVDTCWDDSPTWTMSPDTPLPAPVATAPYCDSEQQNPESMPAFKPQTRSYEFEVTLPSRNISNPNFTAYRPGGTPQGSFNRPHDRPHDPRRVQADSLPSRSTARPKLAKDAEAAPATAIHHSKASGTMEKNKHSTNKETGDDPFLGTGKPMRHSSINSATTKMTGKPPSPTPVRPRSNQIDGAPGLLSLHDIHHEVLLILNTLKTTHRDQTKNVVDAALKKCQEDLKARSQDKNIGTAESNILDREAARIGRARDELSKQAPETNGACSLGEDAAFEKCLRLELTRLMEDARAVIEAASQAKSQAEIEAASQAKRQAASASRSTGGHTPHRALNDYRLISLNSENRALIGQVKQLQAEKAQVLREKSDVQRRLDELQDEVKARRQDQPFEAKFGPWGKDWNTDSKRGG